MSENYILQLIRQQYADTKKAIDDNAVNIGILQDKSERSGETDGFRQYTVAELPYAVDGMTEVRFAFVTDGVDVGESSPNGTGCLCVYKPSEDEWRLVATNVQVIA